MHDDNALIIYTDGSQLQSPRRGGLAYSLVSVDNAGEEVIFDFNPPGYLNATNNEMELLACIEALRHVTGPRSPVRRSGYEKIVFYTDSAYVQEHLYQAEAVWPQSGWITREGEPVLNPDLWKELVRLKHRAGRVEFRKVKAHKTNPHNRRVDRLAKESATLANRRMPSPPTVARKRSPRETEPGGVRMRGQTETIRILVAKTIRGQPHTAYKYEVVDEDSADFEAIDDAFGRDDRVRMWRGHIYEVRLAEPGRGRWVEEILREIDRGTSD